MRLVFALRLPLILFSTWISCAVAAPGHDPCAAPDDAAGLASALPHVAAALQPARTLDILAIGSAAMFAPKPAAVLDAKDGQPPNGQTPEQAFPWKLAKLLQAAVPGTTVQITVRGGRGLLASDMLEIMRSELRLRSYQLVIWQTGTVEAVKNLPPGEFSQVLSDGAELLQSVQADLVLIEPQFSRFLQTNANLDPYTQVLQQMDALPGVVLFRRFDLMRSWANDGQIDLERASQIDRQRVIGTLHACLAKHLSRLVLESARM